MEYTTDGALQPADGAARWNKLGFSAIFNTYPMAGLLCDNSINPAAASHPRHREQPSSGFPGPLLASALSEMGHERSLPLIGAFPSPRLWNPALQPLACGRRPRQGNPIAMQRSRRNVGPICLAIGRCVIFCVRSPGGEPGLNRLCPGLLGFLVHADQRLKKIAGQSRRGESRIRIS